MTGPWHLREAERLLDGKPITSEEHARGIDGARWAPSEMDLRTAQVHATLALAAATAMSDPDGGMGYADWNEWRDAVSATTVPKTQRGTP